MSRKIVYIVVFITTIALVVYNDYQQNSTLNDALDSNETRELNIAESYNSSELPTSLTIQNYQNDEEEITYTYTLKINDIEGAYRYKYNDKESYLVFSAKGESQITLKSNESLTIYDLPVNTNYLIEQINDVSDTYTTTTNNENKTSNEGTISYETIVTFDNKTILSKEEPSKNPFTSSKPITIFVIMCFVSLVIYTIIHKIKITRFE